MTTSLTPAEFLAMPSDPEDAEEFVPTFTETAVPAAGRVIPDERGSLSSIAASLEKIAAAANVSNYLDQQATAAREELEELRQRLADAEALNQIQTDLIERVAEIVKPSTSKLANAVRDALQGIVWSPAQEAEETSPGGGEHNNELDAPPAPDADVEEWRAFARGRGYTGPDIDKANRSQIRTLLGIPQPVAE